jgi:hypothetical protein
LFQVATMVKSSTVTMPGDSSGSAMVKKVRNSPAPSTRADSSSSAGIASAEYVHIR